MSTLDKLQLELKEMQNAVDSLATELAKVSLLPGNSQSVERAVRAMKEAVDQKASQYPGNPIVKAFALESKKTFERHLRHQARAQD